MFPTSCRFLSLSTSLLFSCAVAQEPVQPLPVADQWLRQPRDLWFGVYVDDHKVGHSHIEMRVVERSTGATLERRASMRIRTRNGDLETETTSESEESYDLRPPYLLIQRVERRAQGGGQQSTTEVHRFRDGYVVIAGKGRERTERVMPEVAYGLRDSLAEIGWVLTRPEVGKDLAVRALDIDAMSIVEHTTTLRSVQETMVKGIPVVIHEIERRSGRDGSVERELLDQDGLTMSWSLGSLELRRESEQSAKRLDALVDLDLLGTVKVDRKLGEPTRVCRLVVDVDGDGVGALAKGAAQRLEPLSSRAVRVVVDSKRPGPLATIEERANASKATLRFPCLDPKVVALAQRAVGDADGERVRVEHLLRFVADYVEDSYAESDHLSVQQVIARRRGDCSDHALLFTTLARAVGIPARSVVGLAYAGDDARAFGAHEWCEVVLDGRWVAVDPTWNELPANAARLRFGSDVAASVPTARFELQVVEVELSAR